MTCRGASQMAEMCEKSFCDQISFIMSVMRVIILAINMHSFAVAQSAKSRRWVTRLTPYPRVYSGHNCRCTSNKACVISYLRRFILMTSCKTETETVSRMEKAGSRDCCCSHQSVASPSLILCRGSQWTFRAHFGSFSWFSVFS